jgi:hypothetical protein
MNAISLFGASPAGLFGLGQAYTRPLQADPRVIERAANPYAYALNARAGILNTLASGFQVAQGALSAANAGATTIHNLLNSLQLVAKQALEAPRGTAEVTGAVTLGTTTRIANLAGSATRFADGDVITVSDGTTTATYTAVQGDRAQQFMDAINGTSGLQVSASINNNGYLVLAATGKASITVAASLNGVGTLEGILGVSAGTTLSEVGSTRRSLAEQFDDLRGQIDQAAFAASHKGTNLLTGGSLRLKSSEGGALTLAGTKLTADGLGLAASNNQFQSDADVNAALKTITDALAILQGQSAVLTSSQKVVDTRDTFNKALAATLQQAAGLDGRERSEADALALASRSRKQLAGDRSYSVAYAASAAQARQLAGYG